MPPKSSTNTSAGKQPSKSNSKKTGPIQLQATNLCRKQSKIVKKSMGNRKTLLTTMMEMCTGERSSLQHLLRIRLDKPKVVMQMERILWTPTSIKPLPVHQSNVHLPPLPCSLHKNVLLKNAGSQQRLLSMLHFCATMILCELNRF